MTNVLKTYQSVAVIGRIAYDDERRVEKWLLQPEDDVMLTGHQRRRQPLPSTELKVLFTSPQSSG